MPVERMAFADTAGHTMLSLTTAATGPETVVQAVGDLDMDTAEQFLRHLRGTVSAYAPESLVLDLHGLRFLGAAGVTALLTGADLVRDSGGRLVLRETPRPVRLVLRATRTDELLGG